MRTMKLGVSDLQVPVVAVGCMRLARVDKPAREAVIKTALEHGANFFDHADIYEMGDVNSEEAFAEAVGMTSGVREKLILQSKCGIVRGGCYNSSKQHILAQAEQSLRRLKTDYLDVFLLHRPDILVEPEEVAEAFNLLQESGKVRHFGVSNHNPMQIQLLQKHLSQPLVVNQMQLSIAFALMLTAGIYVNMEHDAAQMRDGSVLDFCRLQDITVQNWSPMQHGFFSGSFIGSPDYPELNKKLDEIAAAHKVSSTTLAVAWLLRHPARMQPITGTMTPARLRDSLLAADLTLSREEWYEIYKAAGNLLP